MKKIFLALMAGVLLASCDLNFFPSDELNDQVLLSDESGAEYIMDGCFALMKNEVAYISYESGNSFVRHYFQLSEFPADNCCLSGRTEDPLYQATTLTMTDDLKNVGTPWMLAYKIISMTNTVIGTTVEGAAAESDHLLGEAYFVRGWLHLCMAHLFAKPYSHGRENLGVPLQISTNSEVVTRAKVGEVYDQIVKDLKKASELLGATSRGNKGYPNKNAALGLLSRVYLYMENWDEVVNTVNAMLAGATPDSKLEKDFANYFRNAKTSEETLFCIAHDAIADDFHPDGMGTIGGMYIVSPEEKRGYGEIYPSNPLLYLYERYPMDLRYTAYIHPQYSGQDVYTVCFPDPTTTDDSSGRLNVICNATPDGDNYTFKGEDGKTYTAEKTLVNGEYYEYYVNNYQGKAEKCLARVHKQMTPRNTHPMYYMSKFSYEGGKAMISSPVICRWAEVILNRAEAYAHLGQDANALEDVNVIRTRAGIPPEGMFATGKMHGYASALDIVLDERRMELAFEGHRTHDLIRNKMDIDRKYPGFQPWAVVKFNDDHLQYPIPNAEWTVSGIQQNPGY